MGNESGKWIMHGMKWDNPNCIHSVDGAIEYINKLGFLPLFKNDIDGFSLEERTVPEYWWSDKPEIDPWMWRAVIANSQCGAYSQHWYIHQCCFCVDCILQISFSSYQISLSFNRSFVTKIRSISISSPCHFYFVLYCFI